MISNIAIAGKLGRQQGELKPFDLLRVQQIREELHARGSFDTNKCKDDLRSVYTQSLTRIGTRVNLTRMRVNARTRIGNWIT